MTTTADLIVFWTIILLRILIPLTIPRYPLPGIIAALILDAVDQSLFQAFTSMQFAGYQGYDKALDIYYLAIAYISTLRNWTNHVALQISRFLFYYRLVGVALFEITQIRVLLLIFPNVFEYFFIFYEIVRLRWDPRRLSSATLVLTTALIWLVIKLPQEYWIHVAQLDVTDMLKENVLGYPAYISWGYILAERPFLPLGFILPLAALVFVSWRVIRPKLPPADWPLSFKPDAHLEKVPGDRLHSAEHLLAKRFFDYELLEKIVLISLLVIIFAQILPGIRSSNLELALAASAVIAVNTIVSETLIRRGRTWAHALQQGIVMVAVNLPVFTLISLLYYGSIPLVALTNIIIFILLLSLIITLYDRYRPIYLVRFIPEY